MNRDKVRRPGTRALLFSLCLAALVLIATDARGEGEAILGFPNWAERVLHQWANRARVEPGVELAACASNPNGCPDASCYSAMGPLAWDVQLSRAARFHSDAMVRQGFFSHTSRCQVVANIDSLYPDSCDGSASCACVGGALPPSCQSGCTSASGRVGLFGRSYAGEIIASPSDPNFAFSLWIREPTNSSTCGFTQQNGHRWLILTSTGSHGPGVAGISTVDFGFGGSPGRIPSGAHYPRQSGTVEMWTNWNDSQGPTEAAVNVEGTCTHLSLARGTETNGAWTATVSGVDSGCHRYYFEFRDVAGEVVSYPTTGSYGIGPNEVTCPDWDSGRPASCFTTPLFSDGFESGNTVAWSITP